MKNYDDWKTEQPEELENTCEFCGEPCMGRFCNKECEQAHITDNYYDNEE